MSSPFALGRIRGTYFVRARSKKRSPSASTWPGTGSAPSTCTGPSGRARPRFCAGTDQRYTVAYVISPNVRRANTFLKIVMDAFDVPVVRSYDNNLKLFETFLIEQYKAKNIPVLFLDEAQNANRDALRLIHYLLNFETATLKLLNFETATLKLLQIVLAGQQELAAKILRYQELASRMFPIAINTMSNA